MQTGERKKEEKQYTYPHEENGELIKIQLKVETDRDLKQETERRMNPNKIGMFLIKKKVKSKHEKQK